MYIVEKIKDNYTKTNDPLTKFIYNRILNEFDCYEDKDLKAMFHSRTVIIPVIRQIEDDVINEFEKIIEDIKEWIDNPDKDEIIKFKLQKLLKCYLSEKYSTSNTQRNIDAVVVIDKIDIESNDIYGGISFTEYISNNEKRIFVESLCLRLNEVLEEMESKKINIDLDLKKYINKNINDELFYECTME